MSGWLTIVLVPLPIEYRPADYRWTCSHYGARLAVVRRDLALGPRSVCTWC